MPQFSHFDSNGASRMVDVSAKPVTHRTARAVTVLLMKPETLRIIQSGGSGKGDVLEVARLAGIMAAKRTDELIPLCHSLGLESVTIDFEFLEDGRLEIFASVSTQGRTGVEMEALTAATICGLTVYDMCKAVDRRMTMTEVMLIEKTGGRSGHFRRDADSNDEQAIQPN